MIICRTPFRISFFGGGTDYPQWFIKHGGIVVGTAIDKYCYVQCRKLPPFFHYKNKIVYSQIETCKEIKDIQHNAFKAALEFTDTENGIEIHYTADLPARTGIGSSSSFMVGLLHSLYAMKGFMVSPIRLAKEATFIEQVQLKETVGCQDQLWAAFGGLNKIEFQKGTGRIVVTPLIIQSNFSDILEQSVVLYYTGLCRTSSEVASRYSDKLISDAEQQQLALMQIAHEGIKEIEEGNIEKIGRLLHNNWEHKRSISPHISNKHIDEIYNTAIRAGAYGGKLIGAGGGGFLLMVVPWDKKRTISDALSGLLTVNIGFEPHGSRIIYYEAE